MIVGDEKLLNLTIEESNQISLSVGSEDALDFSVGEVIHVGGEKYRGAYEWTPSQESQTIQIDGLQAEGNITINPIPSNYGLITWNGATLTVS